MRNVYVEPMPKGRSEGFAIDYYVLEFASGERLTDVAYRLQAQAIGAAESMGHTNVLVARVRHTDKARADHWQLA